MNTIVVFARAPVPGKCKTRLAAVIGDVKAAQLYEAMLYDTIAHVSSLEDVHRVLYTDGCLPTPEGFRAIAQPPTDLTGRLSHAFSLATNVICIGSDAPCAPFSALQTPMQGDVIMGPSRDGGYWAIGMARPLPELLVDMPWSTSSVASVTEQRTRRLGLQLATLPRSFDVDDASDLTILESALRTTPGLAPRTRAFLAGYRVTP